jgi:hypothetical protein
MKNKEYLDTLINHGKKNMIIKSLYIISCILLCLSILLSVKINKQNKVKQAEIEIQKQKYDSLYIEYVIISNEYNRINYSIEHINKKYPKVIDELIYYFENETE